MVGTTVTPIPSSSLHGADTGEVYGYTLRSELVYQLLCELRSSPDFEPSVMMEVIVVDEYQDLNRCDLDTVRLLAEHTGAEVYVVGDDDQSIYSFRHVHPSGIRQFTDEYDGAERLTMVQCRRCGPDVVHVADWLIKQEAGRIPKSLTSITAWPAEVHLLRFTDQAQEAADVARLIDFVIGEGTAPEEVLVLVRSDSRGSIQLASDEQLGAVCGSPCVPTVWRDQPRPGPPTASLVSTSIRRSHRERSR